MELLRAEAELAHWQRQVDVAQAVVAYAQTDGAARPTAAETAAELAGAVSALEAAEDRFGTATAALRDAAGALSDAATRLEELRDAHATVSWVPGSSAVHENCSTHLLYHCLEWRLPERLVAARCGPGRAPYRQPVGRLPQPRASRR